MASRCSLHWFESDVDELLASHKSKETSQQGKQVAKNTNNQGCSSLACKYCTVILWAAQFTAQHPAAVHSLAITCQNLQGVSAFFLAKGVMNLQILVISCCRKNQVQGSRYCLMEFMAVGGIQYRRHIE